MERNILRMTACHTADYAKQLTFWRFRKMANEQSRKPFKNPPNLPSPDVIAAEIVEYLEATLKQFHGIEADLK